MIRKALVVFQLNCNRGKRMFKSIASIIGASAFVMGSGTAYAIPSHIYSTTNPLLLEGIATLGSNVCYLKLTATLADTDNPLVHAPTEDWYNDITNLTGTNDMSMSDPGCAALSIVGGSGSVTSSSSIDLNSLIIRIVTPGGPVNCQAAPVTVSVVNDTSTTVNAVVDQVTPCGYITADLYGTAQID